MLTREVDHGKDGQSPPPFSSPSDPFPGHFLFLSSPRHRPQANSVHAFTTGSPEKWRPLLFSGRALLKGKWNCAGLNLREVWVWAPQNFPNLKGAQSEHWAPPAEHSTLSTSG